MDKSGFFWTFTQISQTQETANYEKSKLQILFWKWQFWFYNSWITSKVSTWNGVILPVISVIAKGNPDKNERNFPKLKKLPKNLRKILFKFVDFVECLSMFSLGLFWFHRSCGAHCFCRDMPWLSRLLFRVLSRSDLRGGLLQGSQQCPALSGETIIM